MSSKLNVLIGCTGSVAAIKIPKLAEMLEIMGYSVIIVPTEKSIHFLISEAISQGRTPVKEKLDPNCQSCAKFAVNSGSPTGRIFICSECKLRSYFPELTFVTDNQEWALWNKRGDQVTHIELRKWANIMVLAPLDANTLAKISNGICDNLLTCVVRAWDFKKVLLFCPAMNTHMYDHPLTSQQINILKSWGFMEIGVVNKSLMCGDTGQGAMAELETIVEKFKCLRT